MTIYKAHVLFFDKVNRNGDLIPSTAVCDTSLVQSPTIRCGVDDAGVWCVIDDRGMLVRDKQSKIVLLLDETSGEKK